LFFGVALDERDLGIAAPGQAKVFQRPLVDREEAGGGAVFGRHIGQRGPIGHCHAGHPGAKVLDEFLHHAFAAQDFRDREHEIGGRGACRKPAGQFEPHNLGQYNIKGLTEHHGFGLDPADAPAQHPKAVDHRRMAVGPYERIGDGHRSQGILTEEDALGEVFEVDLMDDPDRRRNDAEILHRLLAPAEKLVSLAVAGHLQVDVGLQRLGRAEAIDLHRVIDHQVDRNQRVDPIGIAPEPLDGATHRGQIDDCGHAREVLKHHAGRLERHLAPRGHGPAPAGQAFHVLFGHRESVAVSQNRLQQDANRKRQARDLGQARIFQPRNSVDAD
jgi:hypothetical protein